MSLIKIPRFRQIQVKQDGESVILTENGTTVLSLPAEAAEKLALAIKVQAGRAGEQVNAARIVDDQAFLMRKGIPIGLSARRDILTEARKESFWNKILRRNIPKMGRAAKFGIPRIIQSPPNGQSNGQPRGVKT